MDKFNKKVLVGALMAASLGMASSANAFLISPSGGAVAGDVIDVASLDWRPGSLLASCVNCAGTGQVSDILVGDTVLALAHADLGTFDPVGGGPGIAPSGVEWTFVTGFEELVVSATAPSATFNTVAGGTNFFEIWAEAPTSSMLAGTGFNTGTLILSGTVNAFDGLNGATTFTVLSDVPGAFPLDSNGSDAYPGYSTITGVGGGQVAVSIDPTSVDNNYFVGGSFDSLLMSFLTQQNLPFQTADPSSCFWNGTSTITGAGNGLGCGVAGDFGTIGTHNGGAGANLALAGNNTIFQSDASSTMPGAVVPEPGSLALMGLGLVLLGRMRKRTV